MKLSIIAMSHSFRRPWHTPRWRLALRQVLAAIHEERFYILTHPEYNPVIEQRMKDLLSGTHPTVRRAAANAEFHP